MPRRWRALPLAASLHFIGSFIKFLILPQEMFVSESASLPQKGSTWLWIGLVLLPQIYVGRSALRGHLNDVGEVRYDPAVTPRRVINFCKFGIPVVSHILVPVMVVAMAAFKTVDEDTGPGAPFATGLNLDAILFLGLPIAFMSGISMMYLIATKSPADLEKHI